ncbi:hypothetical protein MASR1M66_01950 [Aminivibrio sp.]
MRLDYNAFGNGLLPHFDNMTLDYQASVLRDEIPTARKEVQTPGQQGGRAEDEGGKITFFDTVEWGKETRKLRPITPAERSRKSAIYIRT